MNQASEENEVIFKWALAFVLVFFSFFLAACARLS